MQAWGSWTTLDELTIRTRDAVTIGIAATSADASVRHCVPSLLGRWAIAAVLPGKQTQERAWYYGLRMVAHYVDLNTPVRIHVLSVKAWEAWVQGKHQDLFSDLSQLVTWDQRQRVRALSATKQQVKSMPTTGLSLKSRYQDANNSAMEVAISDS